MDVLKGEIRDAMVGFMEREKIGQTRMASKMVVGVTLINDFVNMKRVPKPNVSAGVKMR